MLGLEIGLVTLAVLGVSGGSFYAGNLYGGQVIPEIQTAITTIQNDIKSIKSIVAPTPVATPTA